MSFTLRSSAAWRCFSAPTSCTAALFSILRRNDPQEGES